MHDPLSEPKKEPDFKKLITGTLGNGGKVILEIDLHTGIEGVTVLNCVN